MHKASFRKFLQEVYPVINTTEALDPRALKWQTNVRKTIQAPAALRTFIASNRRPSGTGTLPGEIIPPCSASLCPRDVSGLSCNTDSGTEAIFDQTQDHYETK
jgi:hypothetical protein